MIDNKKYVCELKKKIPKLRVGSYIVFHQRRNFQSDDFYKDVT